MGDAKSRWGTLSPYNLSTDYNEPKLSKRSPVFLQCSDEKELKSAPRFELMREAYQDTRLYH